MRSKFIFACVTVCPLLLGAAEPVRIQPSSKWVLDYANDSCRLIRQFGEGKHLTRLVFESVAPGGMTMLIIGGTLRPHEGGGEVKARLLPGLGEPFIGNSAEAQNGETGAAFWRNIPLTPGWKDQLKKFDARDFAIRKPITQADREEARTTREALASNTTEVSVTPVAGRNMILEVGSMGKPIAMFDECERDLLRQWGVDPAIQDKIFKPVWTSNPLAWFSSDDYPKAALTRGEESTVIVRLAVDSSGKVTKCASVSAYDAPDINKVVCNVYLTRARFAPAELADGTKVTSYYSQSITFKIP